MALTLSTACHLFKIFTPNSLQEVSLHILVKEVMKLTVLTVNNQIIYNLHVRITFIHTLVYSSEPLQLLPQTFSQSEKQLQQNIILHATYLPHPHANSPTPTPTHPPHASIPTPPHPHPHPHTCDVPVVWLAY